MKLGMIRGICVCRRGEQCWNLGRGNCEDASRLPRCARKAVRATSRRRRMPFRPDVRGDTRSAATEGCLAQRDLDPGAGCQALGLGEGRAW